jgi:hypothetical protein
LKGLQQVVDTILKHCDEDMRMQLLANACRIYKKESLPVKLAFFWLPTLNAY